MPPPSQGYLSLAGARIADGLDLPDDPDDPAWAHLLSESARWAGHDRDAVLFDGADGAELLADDGWTPAAPRSTRERRTGAGRPGGAAAARSTCAWWTARGWASR